MKLARQYEVPHDSYQAIRKNVPLLRSGMEASIGGMGGGVGKGMPYQLT